MPEKTAWVRTLGAEVQYVGSEPYETRCLSAGSGDKPPLLLLSGIGGHVESYLKNVVPLAEKFDNREVIAIDYIGHGFSSAPEDLDYTLEDYADQVEYVLDQLGYESAHVHGESLGGMVSAWMGINRPHRTETIGLNTPAGLLQLDPPTVTEQDKAETQEQLQDLADRTMEMLDAGVTRETVRRRLDWLFVNETPSDELVEIRYQIYKQDQVQEVMPQIYQSTLIDDFHLWSREEVENLDVPVLFIYSSHNPGAPASAAEFATDMMPTSEYHLYEHSAHWPQWEEAKQYNEDTATFVDEYGQ